jgi:iron complex transport system permease protein
LLAIGPLTAVFSADADVSSGEGILFDMGEGTTIWSEAGGIGTIDDTFRRAADASGLDYSSSSGKVTINGVTETTIGAGSSGGTLSKSGATGIKVTSKWVPFKWDAGVKKWVTITDIYAPYVGGAIALGFYAPGQVPVETPEHRNSWTMIRGDSMQTGAQDSVIPEGKEAELKWSSEITAKGVYAAVLYAQGYVFIKYGASNPPAESIFACYTINGEKIWDISFPSVMYYEICSPAIIGEYIYVPLSYGYIFKIPLIEGPGVNNENVTTFGGKKVNTLNIKEMEGAMPQAAGPLTGTIFYNGPSSLVYDSGVIYAASCNGMVYCFDLNLNLIWSRQLEGSAYFFAPTIYKEYLFIGALNGTLYAINKSNGTIIDQAKVYTRTLNDKEYGSVLQISAFNDNGKTVLMFGVSDGRGLSSMIGGVGVYEFDGSKLSKRALILDKFGLVANHNLPVETDGFKGIYIQGTKGMFRVDINGNYELMNDTFTTIRAPMVLVNGTDIYVQSYTIEEPVYVVSLDGKIKKAFTPESVTNFAMSPPLVIDGWVFSCNDSGVNVIYGEFPDYGGSEGADTPLIYTLAVILVIILVILAIVYVVIRFVKGEEKPFNYISKTVRHYLGGEDLRHNKRSKNRLKVVLVIGAMITVGVFIACLCIGYQATMSLGEMFSSLFSAITNGGADPSNLNEVRVFESRLPRTLAALAVGIGLSIAGSMYQAIIRNPLVDPYIMGVSAGAGTAAVAVIAFDFTMFGLFSSNSIYATAIIAMIGGLVAFGITMFIAERAGGSSINYVLAGVVVGLAFSAVQTLMLSMAGQSVSNALTWLFGSFANVSWNEVWVMLLPGLAAAFVPLIWAKEFNLVLLGEDQAQQMGLNVRRFTRTMLILASILTSLCVAFVGIIGFVGLVIPHLCRMMLGGDHRLVLPASIAFGGALMMLADLSARTLYLGQELPVGAITTIIGVPVFAYLLIKRGRMYDG